MCSDRDLVVGLDIGSTYTKAVLLDGNESLVASVVRPTAFKPAVAADRALEDLLRDAGAGIDAIRYVMTTGYGRYMVPSRDGQATELTCHAYSTIRRWPDVRTLLDIGGQDIKAIRLDGQGRVTGFRLNDKCAAGTGAFLEKAAHYLDLKTEDIACYAERGDEPVTISSVCAVFAESEVISHLASGVSAENVLAGMVSSLSERAVQLVKRIGLEPNLALTGGTSRNSAMVRALEVAAGVPICVAPDELGQLSGAFGAALLGWARLRSRDNDGTPDHRVIDAGDRNPEVRRWSAYALRQRAERTCDGCTGAPTLVPVRVAGA